MNDHVQAVVQMLAMYLLMAVAYFGWGKAALRVFGMRGQTDRLDITLIWLGWAFTLFVFQMLHLLFPLTAYVAAPIFAIGVAFASPKIYSAIRRWLLQPSFRLIWFGAFVTVLVMVAWVASRSMLPPILYDSGLYHLNAIRWINSFPIVPGLGNLHGRLAFNQSFFTYVAALNFYPFWGHGASVANSFLFLLTIATFVDALRSVFGRPGLLWETHPFQYAMALFAIPVFVYPAISWPGLSSPTPDLASVLLQLVIFMMLARAVEEWVRERTNQDYAAMLLSILAATAVTIKLSNLAFSAVVIGLVFAYALNTSRDPILSGVRFLLPAAAVVLVWCFRGFLLSGAPLYPSTIGYMDVEWAVPIGKVVEEANWVYSWARQPRTHWSVVLGSWEWLQPWVGRLGTHVVYPLLSSLVCLGIAVVILPYAKRRTAPRYLEWVVLLPIVIGLGFWFFTAPDPRFAMALFWCLSLGTALLFLNTARSLLTKHQFFVVFWCVFVTTNLYSARFAIKSRSACKDVSSSGWHATKTVRLIRKETDSGLVVFVPESGDQCWDSPLPSTPNFNPDLRLRVPGNLAGGFAVTKR